MSPINNTIDADISGRVMSLEQKTRGLQGRISAIEARLSVADAGSAPAAGHTDDMEFIPAAERSGLHAEPDSLEARLSALERSLNGECRSPNDRQALASSFDMTGLIAGAILIGAGILLYSGNFDMIKNPLLPMGCGILLVAGAILRSVIYSYS